MVRLLRWKEESATGLLQSASRTNALWKARFFGLDPVAVPWMCGIERHIKNNWFICFSANSKQVITAFQSVYDDMLANGAKSVTSVEFTISVGDSIKVEGYWSKGNSIKRIDSPTISDFSPSDLFDREFWNAIPRFPGAPRYSIKIVYEQDYEDSVLFTIHGGGVTLTKVLPYVRKEGSKESYPDPFISEIDDQNVVTPKTYDSLDLFFGDIKPWMCGNQKQTKNTWFTCDGASANANQVVSAWQFAYDNITSTGVTNCDSVHLALSGSLSNPSVDVKARYAGQVDGSSQSPLFTPEKTFDLFAPLVPHDDIFSQLLWTGLPRFPGNPYYSISITYEAGYKDSVHFTIDAGTGTVTLPESNYIRQVTMDAGTEITYPDAFVSGAEYDSFGSFFGAIKPYMCGNERQDKNTGFTCLSANSEQVVTAFQSVYNDFSKQSEATSVDQVRFAALGSGSIQVYGGWSGRRSIQNIDSPTISNFGPSDIFSPQVWSDVSDLHFPGNPMYGITIAFSCLPGIKCSYPSNQDRVGFTIADGKVTLALSPHYGRRTDGEWTWWDLPGGPVYESFDLFFDAIKPHTCGNQRHVNNTWFIC